MPLGIRQNNNLLHLMVDVCQDQIFFNETACPTGHFAAQLLNVSEETMRDLIIHGGAISHQIEALAMAGRDDFINLLDATCNSLEKLLDALWHCPPYSLMDKEQELHALEVLFFPGILQRFVESGITCPGIFLSLFVRRLPHPPEPPSLRRGRPVF